jgi:hypothetical protein
MREDCIYRMSRDIDTAQDGGMKGWSYLSDALCVDVAKGLVSSDAKKDRCANRIERLLF